MERRGAVRKLAQRIAELSADPRLRSHRGTTLMPLCPDPKVPMDSWHLVLRDGVVGLARCPRREEKKLKDPSSPVPFFTFEEDLSMVPLLVVGKALVCWEEFRQKVESSLERLWQRP